MLRHYGNEGAVIAAFFLFCVTCVGAQPQGTRTAIVVTVLDETGRAVPDAQVTITEPGQQPAHLRTDYAGNASYKLRQRTPIRFASRSRGFTGQSRAGLTLTRAA